MDSRAADTARGSATVLPPVTERLPPAGPGEPVPAVTLW